MSAPAIVATHFGGAAETPVLLLGPSLGTSAQALWAESAQRLTQQFQVIGWDLPGHGKTPVEQAFSMADLAAAVTRLADSVSPERPIHYAGDSVGGCVGLQLLLDLPDRVATATLLSTGASISTPADWHQRAADVRASGTAAMTEGALQRWFAPGFSERSPQAVAALLDALHSTDDEGYALVCEALAAFDVTDQLSAITAPVLCIAGAHDSPTPPASLQRIASGVQNGRVVVLPNAAHLPPAEVPVQVADLIVSHAA